MLRVVESGDPRRLTRSQHTDEPAAGSGCRSLRKTLRLVSAVAKHAPELLELGLEQREARTGRQPSSRLPPSATARRASRRWMAARAPNSGQWRAPGAVRPLWSTSEPAGRSRQATSTAVPARRATQATPCRARGDNPTTTLTLVPNPILMVFHSCLYRPHAPVPCRDNARPSDLKVYRHIVCLM